MKKKILLFILAYLLLVLTLQNISSLGISPARVTINYEPGLEKEIPLFITGSGKNSMVNIEVRGELAEFITLNKNFINLSDLNSQLFYTIKLPENLSRPGKYEAEIIASEVPFDYDEELIPSIGAVIGVVSQLHVFVPYPDKYIEIEIRVIDSGEGGITKFLIPATNKGKLEINNIQAIIDIYDFKGFLIDTINSSSFSLKPLERAELTANWLDGINAGKYKAVVKIIYDENIKEEEIEFNIGKLALEIKNIIINDFQLGGIAKFNVIVENKWAEDLKDVYLGIIVFDSQGEIIADFKSPTYDINFVEEKEMVAYWDTAGFQEGIYDAKILLNYDIGKSIEKNVKIQVKQNEIIVFGITGEIIGGSESNSNIVLMLVILVILLIIANIMWFVVYKRLLKKKFSLKSKRKK